MLVGGDSAGGAQRWIEIGPFKLQPSEFARITLALILAMFFGENRRGARNTSDLAIGGIFALVPFLLIGKQPDLGTAVTLVPVYLGIAYLAGLRLRLLAIAVGIADPAGPACLELRAQGLPEVAGSSSFSIRSRIRAAPATSRYRRGLPSALAD